LPPVVAVTPDTVTPSEVEADLEPSPVSTPPLPTASFASSAAVVADAEFEFEGDSSASAFVVPQPASASSPTSVVPEEVEAEFDIPRPVAAPPPIPYAPAAAMGHEAEFEFEGEPAAPLAVAPELRRSYRRRLRRSSTSRARWRRLRRFRTRLPAAMDTRRSSSSRGSQPRLSRSLRRPASVVRMKWKRSSTSRARCGTSADSVCARRRDGDTKRNSSSRGASVTRHGRVGACVGGADEVEAEFDIPRRWRRLPPIRSRLPPRWDTRRSSSSRGASVTRHGRAGACVGGAG